MNANKDRITDPRLGPYSFRPVCEQDRPLLAHMIDADPFHAGRVLPDFFLRLHPGEGAWAMEDEWERVVLYLKIENAVRLHIQFGASSTAPDRERNRDALATGVEWLERRLSENSFREMVFDASNPVLARSAQKRLGFVEASADLRRGIPPIDELRRRDVACHSEQMASGRRVN